MAVPVSIDGKSILTFIFLIYCKSKKIKDLLHSISLELFNKKIFVFRGRPPVLKLVLQAKDK
jgi:hypothetical protein